MRSLGLSIVSVPFVGTDIDTALHVVASVVLLGSIVVVAYGFWKFHELPISKAHSQEHHQISLITALTWIGFLWNWVWVMAVVVAFLDGEKALIKIRDIWKNQPQQDAENEEQSNA